MARAGQNGTSRNCGDWSWYKCSERWQYTTSIQQTTRSHRRSHRRWASDVCRDVHIAEKYRTRMKYCGGRGSAMGTVKEIVWSSSKKAFLRRKSSWCSTNSLSLSSTRIQKGSTTLCTLSCAPCHPHLVSLIQKECCRTDVRKSAKEDAVLPVYNKLGGVTNRKRPDLAIT